MPSESDATTIQVTYSESFPAVLTALSGVDQPGDYVAAGTIETPMPSIRVGGAEPLSFPVPASQAKALIKKAGEKAPYGRGEETLVDESVRKVWQVSPAKVKISGEGWQTTFQKILTLVTSGLGCEEGAVRAEFYKLLIYEKGGFFSAHRDSEKAEGMFGTLIVVLPSSHKGGELSVRHAGRETMLDLNGCAPSEVSYAAFYADCEHEVAPIRSGYRHCLVYNLVRASKAAPDAAPDNRRTVAEVAAALNDWRQRYGHEGVPQKLTYLLEHHYTPAGMAFTNLKNQDDAFGRIFLAAAKEARMAVHLGIVHIEEDGWAEFCGDYHPYRRRHRYWDDDDEEDDDEQDYEIGEVCNWDHSINDWVDADDRSIEFGSIPLAANELLPPGALDNAMPDESHFSEATGNEGASFERTYLHAAIVLWPEKASDQICLSAGLDASVARLGELADTVNKDSKSKAGFGRFARLLCKSWKEDPYRVPKNGISDPIRLLTAHGDAKLLADCLSLLLPAHYGKGEHNAVIAEAILQLTAAAAGKVTAGIFTSCTANHCGACLDLWSRLVTLSSDEATPKWLTKAAEVIISQIPKAKGRKAPAPRRSAYGSRGSSLDLDDDDEDAMEPSVKLTTDVLVEWLLLVSDFCPDSLGTKAIEAITANTKAFTPDTILTPALTNLHSAGFPAKWLDMLWGHCASFLTRRSPRPPAEPKDWKQTTKWNCDCPDCALLRRFVTAPDTQVLHMPMAKARRMHIHRIIDGNGIEMTHVTERIGSPHTLVCTKTRTAYDKKCKRHAADVKRLNQLETLADLAISAESTERLRSVRSAIKAATA